MVLQCDICLFPVWVPITLKYRQLLIQVHDIDTTNVSSPYEFPLPWNTGNHSSRYMTLILLPQSMVDLNHMNMVSAVTYVSSPYEFPLPWNTGSYSSRYMTLILLPTSLPRMSSSALKYRQLLIQVHDVGNHVVVHMHFLYVTVVGVALLLHIQGLTHGGPVEMSHASIESQICAFRVFEVKRIKP